MAVDEGQPTAGTAGTAGPAVTAGTAARREHERRRARLDALAGPDLAVLHDRRIPRTRADIDHLVVTGGAVWVVDTKRYRGKRPSLRVEGGLVRPRVEKLLVGGHFTVRGVRVVWPKRLSKELAAATGPLDVATVARALAAAFPSA